MIIRVEHRTGFTVVDNRAVSDARLSWRALGLLVYLLSRPDRWEANAKHLSGLRGDGQGAIRSTLRELEDAGYIERKREHGPDGQFQWVQVIYEVPQPAKAQVAPCVGLPFMGEPSDGGPSAGEPSDGKRAQSKEGTATTRGAKKETPSAPAERSPLDAAAHSLAVLAMEQPVKPVIARTDSPFLAVLGLFRQQLSAGRSVQQLEEAVRRGIDVWTTQGINTSLARLRGSNGRERRQHGHELLVDTIRAAEAAT